MQSIRDGKRNQRISFSESTAWRAGAFLVFQLWVMLSKDECYNQYPFEKLCSLPLSSFRPSRTIILCENKLYSHWNAEYYDTKICIISQISIANMLFFRRVYYVFRRSYSFISHPFFQIKRCYSPSSSIGNDCSLWYFYFLLFSLFFDTI